MSEQILHVKDHDGWNILKKKIDSLPSPRTVYFYQREVWYCSIGHNVGHEEDGKIPDYSRPVVIIKKCGPNLFIGIPLTTKVKNVRYYYPVGNINKRPAMAMIAQLKLYSSKRLINKIDTMPELLFRQLKKATKTFIFK